MTYSNVIATLALLVSLVAIYRTLRWGRPELKVTGDQWIKGVQGESRCAGFELSIINVGDPATEILGAHWQLDKGDDAELYVTMADPGDLPVKLERFGSKTFTTEIPLSGFVDPSVYYRARPVVEFTSRKSRQKIRGDWIESQLRHLAKPE